MDKTVVKAFGVLELLAKFGRPGSLRELALASGLQKSNVHRLLATLIALGYVRQVESRLYEPSLRMWEIGQKVYDGFDIVRVAIPYMQQLVEKTGETSHLVVLDHGDVVYLHKIESSNPVRAYTMIGGRAPAYCTASGKALLAYEDEAVIKAVGKTITAHTALTITTIAELREELALTKRRGYATNLGEFRSNVAGLAAPIRNSQGKILAAVGIAGPLDRLRPRIVKSLASFVIEIAMKISECMGAAAISRKDQATRPAALRLPSSTVRGSTKSARGL